MIFMPESFSISFLRFGYKMIIFQAQLQNCLYFQFFLSQSILSKWEKVTANQLIHLIIKLHFPFRFWRHVPCCSSKCLSPAFPPTSLHRALMVRAACQDFHSFYKYIKNTLQPLLQICPCALLCHSGIATLLNSLSIPLMLLKCITQFTCAVASRGPYCQVAIMFHAKLIHRGQ